MQANTGKNLGLSSKNTYNKYKNTARDNKYKNAARYEKNIEINL